ncbi:MAG: hypothetical protein KAR05_03355 [Candidatus Omnitrophica bacterium]|nr:hypothetical protein [Candidatus Omnitrophota bacterium]
MVQQVALWDLVIHPICVRFANQRSFEPQKSLANGEAVSDGETIEFAPSETLEYIRYVRQCASISPRTYWCEFPCYTVISNSRQHFRLGYRPEDLSDIETTEQKTWEKHQSYLNRLERFPLDKAQYYLRLKEAHGVNSVRGLARITGENWSCIAKLFRILALPTRAKVCKHENIYVQEYQTITDVRRGLKTYFNFYDTERLHQSLDCQTPREVYSGLKFNAQVRKIFHLKNP